MIYPNEKKKPKKFYFFVQIFFFETRFNLPVHISQCCNSFYSWTLFVCRHENQKIKENKQKKNQQPTKLKTSYHHPITILLSMPVERPKTK